MPEYICGVCDGSKGHMVRARSEALDMDVAYLTCEGCKARIKVLEEQRAALLEALEEWERVEEKARAAIFKAEGKEAPDER